MFLLVVIGLLAMAASMTALDSNEIKPQVVHGYPCIKRLNQLYCPSPGRKYPGHSLHVPQVTENSTTILFHTEVFAEQFFEADQAEEEDEEEEQEEVHVRHEEIREEYKQRAHRIMKREKRDLIDMYIDDNKSMVKRMFGEYTSRDVSDPDTRDNSISTFDGSPVVYKKSRKRPKRSNMINSKFNENNKIDTCESAVEIVTPYWASNSAGKIRAIVNTKHLQQAIQQEVCQSVRTKRCKDDCSCEQKYKWHRLLAYDPDDDCKGIFMDWFLFPSCCVCRCANPLLGH